MLSDIASIPEIWAQITAHLSQSDLARFMRVSRGISRSVEAYLYKKLVWTWSHTTPTGSTPIHRLLFNILRRPHLAMHTQELSLREFGYGPKPRLVNAEPVSHEERNLARLAVNVARLPCANRWVEGICNFEAEFIVALLVLQLPKIQKITIDMFARSDGYDSHEAIKINTFAEALRVDLTPGTTGATRFERLTEVHWPSESFDCHADLIRREEVLDIVPLLQAPQLRALSLKLNQPQSPLETASLTSFLAAPSRAISTLTSLSLRYTPVSESLVVRLLGLMENLEVCRLDFCRSVENLSLNAALICDALSPCHLTLRELTIDLQGFEDYTVYEIAPSSPLGSLKAFCSVRHIGATIEALVQDGLELSNVLPRSLNSLKVWQGPVDFDEGFEERLGPIFERFLSVCRLCTPHLESIMIGMHKPPAENDPLYQQFKAKCQQVPNLHTSLFEL